MSTTWTKTIALVSMLCMLLSTDVFAGPGAKPKKMGFFAKVGNAIKKASHKAAVAVKKAAAKTAEAIKTAAKKTGMAIKTAGAKIVNAGMDTGVWAKQKLFGKKNKVWVCGHYDKNGKWTKGHWRKLNSEKPSGGNSADQGNYADQGSYGGAEESNGGDQGGFESNNDAGMSGDGNSYEESNDAPEAGEDPVIPEIPADDNTQSEQSSQESEQTSQSGEAEQGEPFSYDTEVSMRTMGMLMDDIVKQSQSINTFKTSANANINYSVEVQDDINTTYESREDDASLLSRVVVWDIRVHNGEAGQYYSFFLNKLRTLNANDKALVKDVVLQIRAGIVHEANNAATDEEKAIFNKRLSELKGY